MIPADVFERNFDRITRDLERWGETQRDAARIFAERTATYWRLTGKPAIASAASVELILHRRQTFDLAAGSETYESQPITDLDLFAPLLSAIAAGQIVTRRFASAATGLPARIETLIGTPPGAVWRGAADVGRADYGGETIVRDRHYLGWKRD
jgi:hypothetical protein